MKKIQTIKIPKCPRCKKLTDLRVTTELEEGSKEKPKLLLIYGVCDKCKIVLMTRIIETKEIPTNLKEVKQVLKGLK